MLLVTPLFYTRAHVFVGTEGVPVVIVYVCRGKQHPKVNTLQSNILTPFSETM